MDKPPSEDDLESRLERLEARYDLLRHFAIGGIWHALDRIYARTPDAEAVTCIACGFTDESAAFDRRVDACIFGGGRLERFACPSCQAVFGPFSMLSAPADWVSADYKLLYAFYSEADSTAAEIMTFEALRPDPAGVYLNWGAGAWSSSVETLRTRGYQVWGYEPHPTTARPHTFAHLAELPERFDGIFSNNLVEHLTDPVAQFRQWRELLKPGARMAHATPCYEWSYAFTRFHVFFPLGDSASRLAERTGFRIVERLTSESRPNYHGRVFEQA